jgi:hypothetical protein
MRAEKEIDLPPQLQSLAEKLSPRFWPDGKRVDFAIANWVVVLIENNEMQLFSLE